MAKTQIKPTIDASTLEGGAEMVTPRQVKMISAEAETDTRNRWRIEAFREEGVMYAFADSDEPEVLNGNELKMAVYNYRLGLGMGNAGMEPLGGLAPIDAHDPVPSKFVPGVDEHGRTKRVYRRLFKFTPGI
jgi:hypothetical protein